jgi:hypothetical protein
MDKYAILCLFILVILSIWHAIIGALIFAYTPDFRVTPTTWFVYLDRYVLYICIGIYALIHIFLLVWLFFVPLKLRRNLRQKDVQYRQLLSKKKPSSKQKSTKNSEYTPIPIES